MLLDDLHKIADEKGEFIDKAIEDAEKDSATTSAELIRLLILRYILNLDKDANGNIKQTIQNLRAIRQMDVAWDEWQRKGAVKKVIRIIAKVLKINALQLKYHRKLGTLGDWTAASQVNESLGISKDGTIIPGSVMDETLKDRTTLKAAKEYATEAISAGVDAKALEEGLTKKVVETEAAQTKEVTKQILPKADGLNSKLYGKKLGLKYFIYAGTKRKHSRPFCLKRKGKVFTSEEAAKWKDMIGQEDGPILNEADAEKYDPYIDRGGYNCVDDIMFISDETAFQLRPDLRPKN